MGSHSRNQPLAIWANRKLADQPSPSLRHRCPGGFPKDVAETIPKGVRKQAQRIWEQPVRNPLTAAIPTSDFILRLMRIHRNQ